MGKKEIISFATIPQDIIGGRGNGLHDDFDNMRSKRKLIKTIMKKVPSRPIVGFFKIYFDGYEAPPAFDFLHAVIQLFDYNNIILNFPP